MFNKKNSTKQSRHFKEKISGLVKKRIIRENTATFTGINLGSRYIKGLAIKQGKIENYFIYPKEELSLSIEALKKEKKIAGKEIRISFKDPSCLIRYCSFPKTDRKKLKQALYYQLNKLIPYSPDEVHFDYEVLKEISPTQDYILLAVAKKKYIQTLLEPFQEKGFLVSEITPDSIALINLYLNNYPEDSKINACILDIGHSFSTINIFEKGVPFLSRELKFNTKDVIDIILRVKGIDQEKAIETLSCLDKKSDLFDVLEENIADWCKELKNSFDFFELNRGESLNKLYLTGGIVKIPNIADIFSVNLEIPVEILIPEKSDIFEFEDNFSKKSYMNYRHNLAVCFGLVV